MTNTTITRIEELSIQFIYACKNYGSSQLSMFQEDIQRIAPQLVALGVSPSTLDEIYTKHTAG